MTAEEERQNAVSVLEQAMLQAGVQAEDAGRAAQALVDKAVKGSPGG